MIPPILIKLNKKNIFSIFEGLILLILLINFVSAGLCKGSDGYYHDCNDFSDRYYRNNFYPSYKTEYYKETSESKSSIESIKEDSWSYEKISASSSEQTSIESYKKERDYSYPKIRYDKYGREYYDYYEWDDEPHMIVFLNKGPAYSQETDNNDKDRAGWSYWRNKEPYKSKDYDDSQYYDYYYTPRYDNYNQEFNWRW